MILTAIILVITYVWAGYQIAALSQLLRRSTSSRKALIMDAILWPFTLPLLKNYMVFIQNPHSSRIPVDGAL